MTWNYRIIRHPADPRSPYAEPWLGLHEVYYDDNGNITGWTENPVRFACDADEGTEGIIASLQRALASLAKGEVLDVTTLPGYAPPDYPNDALDPFDATGFAWQTRRNRT